MNKILLLLFITLSAIPVFSADDYTLQSNKILSAINPKLKPILLESIKKFKTENSDGGKAITKKEYEALLHFSEETFVNSDGPQKTTPNTEKENEDDVVKHKEDLKRISNLSQKSAAEKATMCSQFADLLFKNTRGSSPFIFGAGAGESKIQMTQSFSLPLIKDLSDEDMENMSTIFQACRFAVNKSNVGACDSCKGITRLAVPILVKQKIENDRFLSHYIIGRPYIGAVPSDDMLVVSSKNIDSTGKQYVFALHTGSEKFSMLNGFDKSISTFLDLGADKTSALLCRFNEFSKELIKRLPKAQCGWVSGDEDFYNGGLVRLGCAPKHMLEGNKLKGHNQYYIKFDHQECK